MDYKTIKVTIKRSMLNGLSSEIAEAVLIESAGDIEAHFGADVAEVKTSLMNSVTATDFDGRKVSLTRREQSEAFGIIQENISEYME